MSLVYPGDIWNDFTTGGCVKTSSYFSSVQIFRVFV